MGKEIKNNHYTNEDILKGFSKEDIRTTLRIVSLINFRSAYGHNPKMSAASADIKRLLESASDK